MRYKNVVLMLVIFQLALTLCANLFWRGVFMLILWDFQYKAQIRELLSLVTQHVLIANLTLTIVLRLLGR
jgi:hypothetical protein